MAVNLEGVFALSQLVGRKKIEAGHGSIISITSVLGLLGSGKIPQASYVASKADVVNLTGELAAQWSSRGARVNALAPGWFLSEMTSEMFSSQRRIDWIGRHTPIGRPGRLSELDGPTLLLASDAGSYTTGETIVVDEGWSIN
jgi:NAD(P)-dependent dehydrogenase (short-subunit alcohol dehydrogenase family)